MNMNLLVQGALYSSQSGYSAWRFANAAIAQGHSIQQVFFYQDAVCQANALATPLSDEFNAPEGWAQLQADYGTELIVCISAAERRGVVGEEQRTDLGLATHNLHPSFTVAGLGALHEATLSADRLVSFR